ncbi:MAG: His/Gly/Thr/Pro-type tRNA ligase C-terminal domain-containing protein, partial [Pseudomonadota bacterium]
PVQTVVTTITSDADDYAREVVQKLKAKGLRVEIDLRNEKINYKIREHSLRKSQLILVVGGREAAEQTVALRRLGGKDQEILKLDEAIAKITAECASPLDK